MDDRDSGSTRRDFLTGFFKRMAKPASRALSALSEKEQPRPALSLYEEPAPSAYSDLPKLLRPPGALPEEQFRVTCFHSGVCVSACPMGALRFWQGDEGMQGTPYIDPEIQACTLCEPMPCMDSCPSGAIMRVPREQVRIGLAKVDQAQCSRDRGEWCRVCIDRCPIGADAIRLDDSDRVEVLEYACVGCGVCQQSCPERPRAIKIEPLEYYAD